jgi:hypothetical protein
MRLGLVVLVLTLSGGCAGGNGAAPGEPADPTDPTPSAPPSASGGAVPNTGVNLVPDGYRGRFRVTATVLRSPEHGPQLCLSVATSLPPQCGGPDIPNWTWNGLRSESAAGSTWGNYLLTGTSEGDTFTLTEPATVAEGGNGSPPTPPLGTLCAEPAGGWKPVDPARATREALEAAQIKANADPDFAGLWVDLRSPPNQPPTGEQDPTTLVLNVRYTKDLARHEAELRAVWGGSLCLTQATRSIADLTRIQNELTDPKAGVTSSSVDIRTGTVEIYVFVATQARQRELDAAYGPGVVRLIGQLTPID